MKTAVNVFSMVVGVGEEERNSMRTWYKVQFQCRTKDKGNYFMWGKKDKDLSFRGDVGVGISLT